MLLSLLTLSPTNHHALIEATSHHLSNPPIPWPKKLEWTLYPELHAGIRFAETRLSDLICRNDCQALGYKGYGIHFIASHGFSPDASDGFPGGVLWVIWYAVFELVGDEANY